MFRRARAQIPFARKWNILRSAEADIGEIAIAVAGKGPWTSNAELLYRHLGFRKRGNLFGDIPRRLRAVIGSSNLRILLLCFLHQLTHRRGCFLVLHAPGLRTRRLRSLSQLRSRVGSNERRSYQ